MATIIREVVIDADARSVWDALRDFGALHERLARGFVTYSRLDGVDTREITFFNGAVARERLIGVDDGARRLAYSVIESRFNATHHHASAQVLDVGDGRSRFVWTMDVLPDALAAPIAALMNTGIEAIKATFEPDPASRWVRGSSATRV
jgi:hypothetical protein